jgi:hypothetical protein
MNDAMIRTNPVEYLRRKLKEWLRAPLGAVQAPGRLAGQLKVLRERGIVLPPESLCDLANRAGLPVPPPGPLPEPGVVGLIVDEREGCGFVTPLRAERGRWHVPHYFPFQAVDLQKLLLRLIHALRLACDGVVPERLSFTLSDGLEEWSRGDSMHVAGLLAILDEVAGRSPLLRRVCALVEPDGECLRPVGMIRQKLDGFRRECGVGTLLVYHPDSDRDVAKYDFKYRWSVASLADLARHAQKPEEGPDLLSPLLDDVELSGEDVKTAYHFLREQIHRDHCYAPAHDLARRLLKCKKGADVSAPVMRDVERSVWDLSRHLGYLEESLKVAEELATRLARPHTITSYDEQADAATLLAATLYHLHRFEQIECILARWEKRLTDDPLLVSPETRMKLLNTLARARIASGSARWREPIEEALRILEDRDPTDRPRTLCYLARGLLRDRKFGDARRALDDAGACPGAPKFSRWVRAFLLADLARRSGDTPFLDPEMENSGQPGKFSEPGEISLPLASYLQATARHPDLTDRTDRFQRAAAVLRREVGQYTPTNLLHGLASLMELAAATSSQEWNNARSRLADFLGPNSRLGLYTYYRDVFDTLADSPDRAAVERLLDRVPHF